MNYNHCQFAGNLTAKPQLQYNSTNNNPFCRASIAVNNYNFKTKANEVMFINCVFFGRNAENLVKYKDKGDNIFVEGRLAVQKYNTNMGEMKTSVSLTVNEMQFIARSQKSGNYNETDFRGNISEESDKIENQFIAKFKKPTTGQNHSSASNDNMKQDTITGGFSDDEDLPDWDE